jgi:uncharacterized protein
MSDKRLQELSVVECQVLLTACHMGRLAMIDEFGPLILPVNYLVDDGTVLFRTDAGSKLDAAVRGAAVAFEADGIDVANRLGWSVVIRGHAQQVTDTADLARIGRLPLVPWAPGRKPYYVRIRAAQTTGRRISVADLPSAWWG